MLLATEDRQDRAAANTAKQHGRQEKKSSKGKKMKSWLRVEKGERRRSIRRQHKVALLHWNGLSRTATPDKSYSARRKDKRMRIQREELEK